MAAVETVPPFLIRGVVVNRRSGSEGVAYIYESQEQGPLAAVRENQSLSDEDAQAIAAQANVDNTEEVANQLQDAVQNVQDELDVPDFDPILL